MTDEYNGSDVENMPGPELELCGPISGVVENAGLCPGIVPVTGVSPTAKGLAPGSMLFSPEESVPIPVVEPAVPIENSDPVPVLKEPGANCEDDPITEVP